LAFDLPAFSGIGRGWPQLRPPRAKGKKKKPTKKLAIAIKKFFILHSPKMRQLLLSTLLRAINPGNFFYWPGRANEPQQFMN